MFVALKYSLRSVPALHRPKVRRCKATPPGLRKLILPAASPPQAEPPTDGGGVVISIARAYQLRLPHVPLRPALDAPPEWFDYTDIDVSWMLRDSGRPKTAFNPRKVTVLEKRTWTTLPRGSDEGRPRDRRRCDPGPRLCPWCGERVVMRADAGWIKCPRCEAPVSYWEGAQHWEWGWEKYVDGEPLARRYSTPIHDSAAFNRARPCPWTSCSAHNYFEVTPANARPADPSPEDDLDDDEAGLTGGTIKMNFPGILPDQLDRMRGTCSLDEAELATGKKQLGLTHPEISERIGVTPQRVEQIEKDAIAKLRDAGPLYQIRRLEQGGDA